MKSTRRLLVAAMLVMGLSSGGVIAEPVAGSVWTEPTTGMEFVYIPAGCFDMGSNAGGKSETPVHKVCLKGFYLGRYEVTQAQFQRVMGKNPSGYQGSSRPVEKVNWKEARDMVAKLKAQTGGWLRLPSEAEWEYACRAGGKHDSYCGDGALVNLAWYSDNSGRETHDVGSKRPNAWGLYDMTGNVWEWTQDCWHSNYSGAPTDGSAWTRNCGKEVRRVLRGGSWNNSASNSRAAYRFSYSPGLQYNSLGFRVARMLP